MGMEKHLTSLIKLMVTIAGLVIVFSGIDVEQSVSRIKLISPITIIIGILVCITHFPAVSIRWKAFVDAMQSQVTMWRAIKLVAVGSFFNQVFFGTVAGDAYRIIFLRQRGATLTVAAGSVMLDRYAALLSMWLAVVFALPIYGSLFVDHPGAYWGIVGIALVGLPLLGLPLVPLFSFVERTEWLSFLHGLYRFSATLSAAFTSTLFSVSAFSRVHLPSLYIILSSSVIVWLIAIDLGAPLSFGMSTLITPAAILVAAIPVTIGGWGLRELSFVTLLGAVSVEPESAVVISVAFGLMAMAAALIGGLIWLIDRPMESVPMETS